MKKMILGFAMLMTMVATASVFANSHGEECVAHDHYSSNVQISTQGPRCSGTVGCGCRGFVPITNGDVWQQAYCRYCGHHRSYHR